MRDGRKVVCRRCHHVMDDIEPGHPNGEFYHKKAFKDGKENPCRNAGKTLRTDDSEVVPFERKRVRRAAGSHGGLASGRKERPRGPSPRPRAESECCRAPVWWETLGSMRVVRTVGRNRQYSAMCSKCRRTWSVSASKVRTPAPYGDG